MAGALIGWYDASRLLLSDADAIATWPDLSGNGRDLAQGTAGSRPTFKTGIQNGLAVARFDGGDFINRATVNLSAYTAITILATCKATSFVASHAVFSFGTIGTTAGSIELRGLLTTGTLQVIGFGTGTSIWTAPALGSAWHCVAGRIDFSAASGSEQLAWVDGDSTGSSGGDFNNTGAFSTNAVMTIGDRQSSSHQWLGDIGEVLVYGSALSNTNRLAVEAYLKAKWGTP